MRYIKLSNGQPEAYSIAQLRRDNPNTSFPKQPSDALLAEWGVYPVMDLEQPQVGLGQVAEIDDTPSLVDGKWVMGWTVRNVPATADMVKAETNRRILALCPEWKQRNLTAQAARLAAKGRENWTAEEAAQWEKGEALWAQIYAIRVRSDKIERMSPIPHDFQDDSYWV